MYEQLGMRTSASKGTASFKPEFWRGALDGPGRGQVPRKASQFFHPRHVDRSRSPLEPLEAATRFLEVWNFARSFKREALSCLDVTFVTA